MSFFALLTLVPSTVAVGAALSFLERFVGPQRIARGQDEAVAALRVLMSPRLTDEVIAPFVRAQLSQQRGGVALGGLVRLGGCPATSSLRPATRWTGPTA